MQSAKLDISTSLRSAQHDREVQVDAIIAFHNGRKNAKTYNIK